MVSRTGPSVPGTGTGSVRGRVYFYYLASCNALVSKSTATTWSSGLDRITITRRFTVGFSAYNKSSLQLTGVFNDTPNGSDGGIWNSGSPIQADSQGYLYTETGNGTFDTRLNRAGFPSRGDYGDSVLKLALDPGFKGPNGTGIRVVDCFTPNNQAALDVRDLDLASSGVLILPDGSGGPRTPTSCSPPASKGPSTSSTGTTWEYSVKSPMISFRC